MNILFLAPTLLGDIAIDGGTVSTLGFLKSLLSNHTIYVVAFDGKADAATCAAAKADMQRWATEVRIIQLSLTLPQKILARFRQTVLMRTEAVFFESAAFERACREIRASNPIDLVIIQFPQMAQYISVFDGIPTIMDVQDAFSISKFRKYAATTSPFKKLASAINWLKWVRYERLYYKKFSHLFVVTEQDRYGLALFRPELPMTVLPRSLPIPAASKASRNPTYQVGFIGSLNHEPNVVALTFFLQNISPLLSSQIPNMKVLIAGKNPPAILMDQAPEYVTFSGYLPSVDDFYSQVAVVIAPLVTGGGIKIKVMEALLAGLPIVTTSIGAEGIGLTHGVNVLIADNPEHFAEAIVSLWNDPVARIRIGEAGRQHAIPICSIDTNSKVIEEVLRSVSEAY